MKGNNKGKFMKQERITLVGEIIKNKDKGTPSPAQYEMKKLQTIIGNYKM